MPPQGGETTVKWLGEQKVQPRFLDPAQINPICIRTGALADGVPSRDPWVSQEHAIDGLLISAGALVNGNERDGAALIPEMALLRISAARLVPEGVRARLTERADVPVSIRAA